MHHKFGITAAVFGLAFLGALAFAQGEKSKPEVTEGYIHTADGEAHSFVLGGKNESQTKFKVLVKVEGNKEPAHILLDGKKSTFEAAIQPKRKAAVTYVKLAGDELWVWKVDVTSAAK